MYKEKFIINPAKLLEENNALQKRIAKLEKDYNSNHVNPLNSNKSNGFNGINGNSIYDEHSVAELRKSEKQLRTIIDYSPNGITVTDLEGKIIDCNQATLMLHGYINKDELMGMNGFSLISKKDIPSANKILLETINAEKVRNIELQLVRKDGSEFHGEFSLNLIKDKNGNPQNLVVISTDISDRKKAEEDLISEKLFSETLIDSLPGVFFLYDDSNPSKLIRWNKNHEIVTGYTTEESKNKNPFDFVKRNEQKKLAKEIHKLRTTGQVNFKFDIKMKNGKTVPYYFQAIKSKGLEKDYFLGVGIDLSEDIKTEDALKESEHRFKTLSEATFEGIVLSEKGKIIDVNQQLADILGYNIKELIGTKVEKMVYPNDVDLVIAKIISKSEDPYEHRAVRKDGKIIYVKIHPKMFWSNGRLIRMSAVIDISEQKRSEIALNESEERFKRLFYDLGDAVFVSKIGGFDRGKILEVNPAAEKQTGYTYNELLSMNIGSDLAISSSGDLNHDEWDKLLQNGKVVNSTEKKRRKDGSEYWVEVLVTPIIYRGSRASISINRDIDERKKSEKELNIYKLHLEKLVKERTKQLKKANKKLETKILYQKEAEQKTQNALEKERELNELKSRFISTASHEFRTPLSVIQSSTELLDRYGRNWTEEKYQEQVAKIIASVNNLTELMDDMLTVSWTETGKMKFDPKEINLEKICKNILNDIEPLTEANQSILFNYLVDEIEFMLDEKLLKLILINLLSNAIKYCPQCPQVKFNVLKEKNSLIFKISDNGIGISKDDQRNLFTPFYRSLNAVQFPGTGLGLSIVKKSVELHNGSILVNSDLGEGSEFIVNIPIRK